MRRYRKGAFTDNDGRNVSLSKRLTTESSWINEALEGQTMLDVGFEAMTGWYDLWCGAFENDCINAGRILKWMLVNLKLEDGQEIFRQGL